MRKKFLLVALLAGLISAGVELISWLGWLEGPEHVYEDLWHQAAGRRYQPRHVVIVTVDDQARLAYQDEPLVFWGPHFARAIAVLRQAGVRSVGLDFLFSHSAESWLKKLKLPESEVSRMYDVPLREQLSSGQVVLAANLVLDENGRKKVTLPIADYWLSLPGKLDDVGLVNFYSDPDGVIRRYLPALPDEEGEVWGTFPQLLAEKAGAAKPHSLMEAPRVSFAGPPGTIPRLPFRRLLQPEAAADSDLRALKDKIVIIGAEFSGMQDIVLTPYARSFPGLPVRMMTGAELQAQIVETLLGGPPLQPLPPPLPAVYLFLVLSAVTLAFFRLSPLWGLAILVAGALAAAGFAFLAFRHSLLLSAAGVQLGMVLCYLGTLGLRLRREERERARVRQVFGRYVSEDVVEKLLASGGQPNLGGDSLQVTVLFADIRNFTTISEILAPQEVVEFLNRHFSRACEPILELGGSVDKFIGDAVMAVFGSTGPLPDHAHLAVQAALALVGRAREVGEWLARRFPGRPLPPFRLGVGLHSGEAVVGNIGSPKRLEFTTIGDTVNTASRLQNLSKELGWTIVASLDTIKAAGPGVITGGHQVVEVKGRREPVEVFEVLGVDAGAGFSASG